MLSALTIPIILGMTGMAVDLGTYASERRDLQNAADAIALAAGRDLPDGATADAVADQWAVKNDIDPNDVTVTITGGTTDPKVRVEINRDHEFAFIKVIGIDSKDVSAVAAAKKFSYGGGTGVVPWSITQATVDWAEAQGAGALVTMKFDSNGGQNGNFGAIRVDGSGASDYEDAVKFGADSSICAQGTTNCTTGACPGTYPTTCAENAPECDGQECKPKTGNMTGPTRDATDHRMNNTSTTCDTFAETFTGPDANGKFALNPDCNPWIDGPGKCPVPDTSPYAKCSRRVIVIPVVDGYGNGSSSDVTILRFALIYLQGYDSGKCSGSNCEIKGNFVRADVNMGGITAAYDNESSINFSKLTE
jgi:hypothetical protein